MAYSVFKWTFLDDVVVSFATEGPVRDEPWSQFVSELRSKELVAYLATNRGAAKINSVQRKMAADAIEGKGIPIAVVTDERLVRGIVTAAAWLGMNVKAFSWSHLDDALRYLSIPSSKVRAIERVIEDLQQAAEAEHRQSSRR